MFTGIVETKGNIHSIQKKKTGLTIGIKPLKKITRIKIGESIAVNGVCLTVFKSLRGIIYFDIIQQTLRVSNLKYLKIKDSVNLERALKYGDRLGGHYVLGHIDAIGQLSKIIQDTKEIEFRIKYPKKLSRYIIDKACIAINGISLTIGKVRKNDFSVFLIPHTLKVTTLSKSLVKDAINLEVDIVLKTGERPS
ncbi:MAG: riboflavin synthase [Candidatus Omnitrophota bacterium]|jgi:riboflavin synthase